MLYLNQGGGIFTDVSYESGVIHQAGGFGCAVGDLDGNGQVDIIAANSDFISKQVYINQNLIPSFIKVKVIGNPPNTLALGAIVELYGTDGPALDRTFLGVREISSHPSLYCVNDPVAHFGTGDFTDLEIIIRFQSLAVLDTVGISPGQTVVLHEPQPTPVDQTDPPTPEEFLTLQAYPNPFNGSSTILFGGNAGDNYSLTIFDLLGRQVNFAELFSSTSGPVSFVWDGLDIDDNQVPSGVYFIRVDSGRSNAGLKVTLLR
jgi:hypothetical protein